MPELYAIRADYDRDTIAVYQAYNDAIADVAVARQRFASPFSFHRMTWIKPSFLWLMHRSNWGTKRGQHRTLRIRIPREKWDELLAQSVLTSPDGPTFRNPDVWEPEFREASVHVQWDPERSLRGAALNHYSIQVGIGRALIREFGESWISSIDDLSPTVAKIRSLIRTGKAKNAAKLLPPERPYPMPEAAVQRLRIR